MERFVVISADCHAVGRPDEFTPYLDEQYREAYAASQAVRSEFAAGRSKAVNQGLQPRRDTGHDDLRCGG